MAVMKTVLLVLLALVSSAACKSTFSPARPPAIPLAQRNPYLNTVLFAGSATENSGHLAGQWPTFWRGQINGWTGMIHVDGVNYIWMGDPSGVPTRTVDQVHFEYTSTRSIFTMHVNNTVEMIVEFLSPVTPTDMKRSSFPVSYMNVQVSSLDGESHSVQVYTDISAEWISGHENALAQWDYGVISPSSKRSENLDKDSVGAQSPLEKRSHERSDISGTKLVFDDFGAPTVNYEKVLTAKPTPHANRPNGENPTSTAEAHRAIPTNKNPGGVAYHHVFRQNQVMFGEFNDKTEYGDWYYATENSKDLTHQQGPDIKVRGQFAKEGYLTGHLNKKFRAINDSFPVFGFARNFGSVSKSSTKSALFTINLAQDKVVRFEAARGNVSLPGLWTSYFDNDALSAVAFFYQDFKKVSKMTTDLDNQVLQDSKAAAGQNYATITSLAVRQAFGSLQFAIDNETSSDNHLLFMKEISSDGDTNTVDVIFPFHPIALYLNPKLIKMLLDPLFINQEAGYWKFKFALHDLGVYPHAWGYNSKYWQKHVEKQPLEECGNMILMALAYAQRTGDYHYLKKHYQILRQWNTFLIKEALIPRNQISTDDFAGSLANQTNLALKGIIGIEAMSEISKKTGNHDDAQSFKKTAHKYIRKWQNLGIAKDANPPHTTLAYHKNKTHGLLYNLWADRALGLGLVPESVYNMQSNFYPTVAEKYGVPLDTRHEYTKGDWEMFCAAIASESTRDLFVDKLATWIQQTPTFLSFTDLYEVKSGNFPKTVLFYNRPVVGGMFALLALNSAPSS